jgi:hypothetical protein
MSETFGHEFNDRNLDEVTARSADVRPNLPHARKTNVVFAPGTSQRVDGSSTVKREPMIIAQDFKVSCGDKTDVPYQIFAVWFAVEWSDWFLVAQNPSTELTDDADEGELPALSAATLSRIFYLAGFVLKKLLLSKKYDSRQNEVLRIWFDGALDRVELCKLLGDAGLAEMQLIYSKGIIPATDTISSATSQSTSADVTTKESPSNPLIATSQESEEQENACDDDLDSDDDDTVEAAAVEKAKRDMAEVKTLAFADDTIYLQALSWQKTWMYGVLQLPNLAMLRFCIALEQVTVMTLNARRINALGDKKSIAKHVNKKLHLHLKSHDTQLEHLFEVACGCAELQHHAAGNLKTLRSKAMWFIVENWVSLRVDRWLERHEEEIRGGKSKGAAVSFRASMTLPKAEEKAPAGKD